MMKMETNLGVDLTVREVEFLKQYTNPEGGTYLNAKNSAQAVGYAGATNLMGRERVRRALGRILAEDYAIDEMIMSGVKQRLKDPDSNHWQETANFVCKLRGDYAERENSGGLSEVEREARIEMMKGVVGGVGGEEGDVSETLIEVGDGD